MSNRFYERLGNEVEEADLELVESIVRQLELLINEDLEGRDYEFWEQLSNTLGNLRSRIFADTPGKIVWSQENNTSDISYTVREGILDNKSDSSVFSKLYGIAQHDITKPFDFLITATGWMMYETLPSSWEDKSLVEYLDAIKNELRKLVEFVRILMKASTQEFQSTSVAREEFLGTLGATESTIRNSKGELVECALNVEFENFNDIEEFLSVRTIVLNAIDNGAGYILVRRIGEDIIEVIDDISDSWESSEKVKMYKENVEIAYNKGVENPLENSKEERRGGAIASFLAGQRYGRSDRSEQSFYELKDKVNIPRTDIVGKSFLIKFKAGTTITDLLREQQEEDKAA